MSQNHSQKIAAFFAAAGTLHDARVLDEAPEVNAVIELNERDLHTRSHEHCTRPCCAVEPKASFTVVSVTRFRGGWEGLSDVVEAREWEEAGCRRHEWCSLFDSYSLAGYLGVAPDADELPGLVLLIEVARAA